MKKMLIVVLLGMLALPISARAAIEQPKNVPEAEKFELLQESATTCGAMQLWVYWVTDRETWSKRFLGNLAHPLVLRHAVLLTSSEIIKEEIWLDRNRDGVFDEKYANFGELVEKYPTPCDAVL